VTAFARAANGRSGARLDAGIAMRQKLRQGAHYLPVDHGQSVLVAPVRASAGKGDGDDSFPR
jgi:hypothetical protein